MAVWVDQMFNVSANATTLTGLNAGTTTSVGAYLPAYSGRLIRATLVAAGQAASSLLELLRVEISCNIWIPNTLRFGAAGGALRTAPAFPIAPTPWDMDQLVNTSQGINGQYLFNVTAVTPALAVYGHFSDRPVASMAIPGF